MSLPRIRSRAAAAAVSAVFCVALSAQERLQTRAAPVEPAVPGTVAVLTWNSGPVAMQGIDDLLGNLALPPRVRGALTLGRGALQLQLGGRTLAQALELLAPVDGALGLSVAGADTTVWMCAAAHPDVDSDERADLLEILVERGLHIEESANGLAIATDRALLAPLTRSLASQASDDGSANTPPWSTDLVPGVVQPGEATAERGIVRAWLDIATLRQSEDAWRDLDAGGRFLVGPYAALADRCSRIDASLRCDRAGLQLQVRADAAPGLPAAEAFSGAGSRNLPTAPRGRLMTLRLDRALRRFIERRDAILEPGDAAQLGGGLSIADAISGGRFTEDVLALLSEPMTLFLVDSTPREADAEAGYDLPGLVSVTPLRDPEQAGLLRARLRRTWATLWLASNVERKREGQLEYTVRPRVEAALDATLFVAEPDTWQGPPPAPTEAGLTPTFAVAHGHFVLASTADAAARALAALQSRGTSQTSPTRTGTTSDSSWSDQIHFAPRAAAEFVDRNLTLLATQQMFEKGQSEAKARRELQDFAGILRAFEAAELQVTGGVDTGSTTLSLQLRTAGEARPARGAK